MLCSSQLPPTISPVTFGSSWQAAIFSAKAEWDSACTLLKRWQWYPCVGEALTAVPAYARNILGINKVPTLTPSSRTKYVPGKKNLKIQLPEVGTLCYWKKFLNTHYLGNNFFDWSHGNFLELEIGPKKANSPNPFIYKGTDWRAEQRRGCLVSPTGSPLN